MRLPEGGGQDGRRYSGKPALNTSGPQQTGKEGACQWPIRSIHFAIAG